MSVQYLLGVGAGDPHYNPFDWMGNEWHHFQGRGDFTIMEVIIKEELVFTLQGRLEDLYNNGYTWHAGLACGGSDIAFEVSFQILKIIMLLEDGKQVTNQFIISLAWFYPNKVSVSFV